MKLRVLHDTRARALEELDGDAVVVEGLSKCYHGIAERLFEAPTPILTRAFKGRRPRGIEEDTEDEEDEGVEDEFEGIEEEDEVEDVWALRDVSFRVPRGGAVALIGGPGSGKTTLLKVLARAAPPSSGRAILDGRSSPLIAYALQFLVPTYSPTQNAALCAALIGVPKRRLRPHLDEIFAFVELSEKERKASVTRSPGALAVATALNLGADVLLLDEPFSVLPPSLRERCIETIEARRGEGATVLLETGDREALRRICEHAIWFDGGGVVQEGPIDEILTAYDAALRDERSSAPATGENAPRHGFNETATIASARADIAPDRTATVEVMLELTRPATLVQVGVGLESEDGRGLWVEQPEPVICEMPGFQSVRVSVADVPRGVYGGLVQVRVFDAGAETLIGRRRAFALGQGGAPPEDAPEAAIWERRDGAWTMAAASG